MADFFVDFSATNDGDGSSYAQAASPAATGAYNTIAGKSFSSGDKVWIRRQSKVVSAQVAFNFSNVLFIGWPKTGDLYYASRPSAPQTTWDADSAIYAEIKTTTLVTTPFINISTNNGQEFHRIKFTQGYTTSSALDAIGLTSTANFYNCWIENQNNSSAVVARCLNYTGTGISRLKNCTVLYSGSVSGNVAYAGAVILNSGTGSILEIVDCTIQQSNVSWNPIFTGSGLVVSTSTATTYLIGCSIISNSTNFAGRTNTVALVQCTSTNAMYMHECSISTDSTGLSMSLRVASGNFIGTRISFDKVSYIVLAGNGSVLHLSKFNQTVATSGYSIELTGTGNELTGNNITFIGGNTSGDMLLSGTNGNPVFLQNVTFAHATPFGGAPGVFTGVWCADYGGTLGLWRFFGPNGEITSNNVSRSGGEAFSLKYDINSGNTGDPLWRHLLAMYPAFETIWVSLPASVSTITFYGAHKNYGSTPPDASDLWFEADYLADASGCRRAFATSRDNTTVAAALTTDSSTWSGDTGLTSFKLSITVTPGQACLAPLRIYFKKRISTAYLYIDPKPVVS